MNISKWLIFLPLLSMTTLAQSLQVTEDPYYIYTTRNFAEIADEYQNALIAHSYTLFQSRLRDLNIPTLWTEEAEKTLLGDPARFTDIINYIKDRAHASPFTHVIRPADLIPTGFIVGFGASGSGNYVVGMGGAVLMTFIIVPLQIDQFDKITGETTTYYELSWAIGGIAQGAVGFGAGASASVHGAIGLIWGDIPDASSLTGPAVGVNASIAYLQGLGIKVALAFNTTTKERNLVAMATYDTGAQTVTAIEGLFCYFMRVNDLLKFITGNPALTDIGKEFISQADLSIGIPNA